MAQNRSMFYKTLISISIILFLGKFSFAQQNQNIEIEQIRKLINQEQYKEAIKNLNKILDQDANNEEALYLLGTVAYDLEEYNTAEQIFTDLIIDHPNNHLYYGMRGLVKHTTGRFQMAINDYKKQLTFTDSDSIKLQNYVNQGSAFLYLREFDSAKHILQYALEIDSTSIGIWNNLGNTYQEMGDDQNALRCLQKVIEIDHNFIGGYINLGIWYQDKDKHKEAIQNFNKAIAIDKNLALGYSNRAYSYLKINKIKDALSDINKSLKMYNSNSYAYRIRGEIYLAQKEYNKACEDWKLAEKLKYTEMYGDAVELLLKEYCK